MNFEKFVEAIIIASEYATDTTSYIINSLQPFLRSTYIDEWGMHNLYQHDDEIIGISFRAGVWCEWWIESEV